MKRHPLVRLEAAPTVCVDIAALHAAAAGDADSPDVDDRVGWDSLEETGKRNWGGSELVQLLEGGCSVDRSD